MVLSDNGDHPMTKLSDTQARHPQCGFPARRWCPVLPLPETLKIKGGAVDKVLGQPQGQGPDRSPGCSARRRPPPLRITRAGLQAIGLETEDDTPEGATPADTGATSADAAVEAAAPAKGANRAATPAKKGKAAKSKARVTKTARADKPTLRAGTKQAQMIAMLKRPEGATVEQM